MKLYHSKEQFSDVYRTINPLDEAFPEVPLLGTTPKAKAVITMWERRAELEGFAAVMEGVRNAAAGLKGVPSPARMAMSRFRRWWIRPNSGWRISTPTLTPD